MNLFKSLDSLFHFGPVRTPGEFVTISIRILGRDYSAMRPMRHENVSIDAFHMHRDLVRQFCDANHKLSFWDDKAVRRYIALCVLNSYIAFRHDASQAFEYLIEIPYAALASQRSQELSCWWVVDVLDYREICDDANKKESLRTISGRATDDFVKRRAQK